MTSPDIHYDLIALINASALAMWANSRGWRDNRWATKENNTQEPRNPSKLKNAAREYNRSSSSVRNDWKIRRILAKIIDLLWYENPVPQNLLVMGFSFRFQWQLFFLLPFFFPNLSKLEPVFKKTFKEKKEEKPNTSFFIKFAVPILPKKTKTCLKSVIGIGCLKVTSSSHIALNSL